MAYKKNNYYYNTLSYIYKKHPNVEENFTLATEVLPMAHYSFCDCSPIET